MSASVCAPVTNIALSSRRRCDIPMSVDGLAPPPSSLRPVSLRLKPGSSTTTLSWIPASAAARATGWRLVASNVMPTPSVISSRCLIPVAPFIARVTDWNAPTCRSVVCRVSAAVRRAWTWRSEAHLLATTMLSTATFGMSVVSP